MLHTSHPRYPGRSQQEAFFTAYAGQDLTSQQIDRLCAEADLFALASHMYWGVWAIIQARYSPVDFDYLQYHGLRWSEFHRRKSEFVETARAVFGL